jgi:hypothetical protein
MRNFVRDIGSGFYNLFIGTLIVVLVAGGCAFATNYLMTQGAGTTFGSIVVSTVNYPQMLNCDPATPTQCAAVDASGNFSVKSTTLATKANQDTNAATTAHTCSVSGFSEIGCLGQIDDDVKGPLAPQTAPYTVIGAVISGGSNYNTVAASQTAQALTGGSGGATGDYLSHCVIYPSSTSPGGAVTVFDNTTSATNLAINFAGGASSLSNLAPISIPVGAVSKNGPWKATTPTGVTMTCYGIFH